MASSEILNAADSGSLKGGASFSIMNRFIRAVWNSVWFVFAAWTPPFLHGWRRSLLRLFGAEVGFGARIYGSSKIWLPSKLKLGKYAVLGPGVICYNMAEICIGDASVVSQRAHLCAGSHKIDDPHFQLIARPITIGDRAWVAAEAFVGPGVKIGEGAVLGARGVATGDLEPWSVYAGNPAKLLKMRSMSKPV